MLDPGDQDKILNADGIEMCIFAKAELDEYSRAFRAEQGKPTMQYTLAITGSTAGVRCDVNVLVQPMAFDNVSERGGGGSKARGKGGRRLRMQRGDAVKSVVQIWVCNRTSRPKSAETRPNIFFDDGPSSAELEASAKSLECERQKHSISERLCVQLLLDECSAECCPLLSKRRLREDGQNGEWMRSVKAVVKIGDHAEKIREATLTLHEAIQTESSTAWLDPLLAWIAGSNAHGPWSPNFQLNVPPPPPPPSKSGQDTRDTRHERHEGQGSCSAGACHPGYGGVSAAAGSFPPYNQMRQICVAFEGRGLSGLELSGVWFKQMPHNLQQPPHQAPLQHLLATGPVSMPAPSPSAHDREEVIREACKAHDIAKAVMMIANLSDDDGLQILPNVLEDLNQALQEVAQSDGEEGRLRSVPAEHLAELAYQMGRIPVSPGRMLRKTRLPRAPDSPLIP
ncbi:unnamed protein product [Symbiodinium necroappetens]|uniref:Uncharacterized protein n=1 Tax=Symbiodinium necroappetens TaxID=1628268 RepID=A0A813ANI3_9DINO|nr:unnamed protein product [Symbiodinium necroappetens]